VVQETLQKRLVYTGVYGVNAGGGKAEDGAGSPIGV